MKESRCRARSVSRIGASTEVSMPAMLGCCGHLSNPLHVLGQGGKVHSETGQAGLNSDERMPSGLTGQEADRFNRIVSDIRGLNIGNCVRFWLPGKICHPVAGYPPMGAFGTLRARASRTGHASTGNLIENWRPDESSLRPISSSFRMTDCQRDPGRANGQRSLATDNTMEQGSPAFLGLRITNRLDAMGEAFAGSKGGWAWLSVS